MRTGTKPLYVNPENKLWTEWQRVKTFAYFPESPFVYLSEHKSRVPSLKSFLFYQVSEIRLKLEHFSSLMQVINLKSWPKYQNKPWKGIQTLNFYNGTKIEEREEQSDILFSFPTRNFNQNGQRDMMTLQTWTSGFIEQESRLLSRPNYKPSRNNSKSPGRRDVTKWRNSGFAINPPWHSQDALCPSNDAEV